VQLINKPMTNTLIWWVVAPVVALSSHQSHLLCGRERFGKPPQHGDAMIAAQGVLLQAGQQTVHICSDASE
jgi:hypothetical protein